MRAKWEPNESVISSQKEEVQQLVVEIASFQLETSQYQKLLSI